MELIRVVPSDSRLWEQVWRVYTESFPDYERRRISSHGRATEDPAFHTYIALDNGNLMALLFYWKSDKTIYVEHIAVNLNMRGKSVGSTLLGEFMQQHEGYTIILEIDPPVDDISQRRLSFYQKLGYVLNDYHYMHPSYSKNGMPHELKIMSYPNAISEKEFADFKQFMGDVVMKYID